MSRVFSQPVSMKGPTNRLNHDLRGPLEAIGYTVEDFGTAPERTIASYWMDVKSAVGATEIPEADGRVFIQGYNAELFLALAAMSEGDEFWPGEYVTFKDGECPGGPWAMGFLYKVLSTDSNYVYVEFKDRLGLSPERFRKATKEEIIANFTENPALVPAEQAPLPEVWVPKLLEKVRVRDHHLAEWKERYFLFKRGRGVCVVDESEMGHYAAGERFVVQQWGYCEPIPKDILVSASDLIEAWAKANGKDAKLVKLRR